MTKWVCRVCCGNSKTAVPCQLTVYYPASDRGDLRNPGKCPFACDWMEFKAEWKKVKRDETKV